MNVLFVVPYPIEAPSTRYRVYQYLPYLQANGIEPTVSRFIDSSKFFKRLYQPGGAAYKAAYFVAQSVRRFLDLTRVHRFDAIFIQREALPVVPALFERLTKRLGAPIIYDFDDAIYLPRSSAANRWVSWLKQPGKTADIVRLSNHVIVGNRVLYDYASQFNTAVTIIPSSVDMRTYTMRSAPSKDGRVTIGWVGSGTNLEYLAELAPALYKICAEQPAEVSIVGGEVELPGVPVSIRPWQLATEIEDLHSFDIGIMPLPDDPWTRGKGGFKAIQYMGVGLPVVASPVGINTEIITHGVNGFLADTPAEWQQALATLVRDATLRCELGRAG
ncbi:MAG: glycosyltransferase family 4 protein, partial [Caldilineaceae bacterium]|nr:glycosyltransferase family 4 protein [Caldilineaceae bacterium]